MQQGLAYLFMKPDMLSHLQTAKENLQAVLGEGFELRVRIGWADRDYFDAEPTVAVFIDSQLPGELIFDLLRRGVYVFVGFLHEKDVSFDRI